MGDCIFCGDSAGFLRSEHKECRKQHEQGKVELVSLVADAAAGAIDLSQLPGYLRKTAKASYIDRPTMTKLLLIGYDRAVDHVLDDHMLSKAEEAVLDRIAETLPISPAQLDSNGAQSKLVKAAILRDLSEGIIPQRVNVQGFLPFNLQKSESLIWIFQDVQYLVDKTKRQFKGRSHGISLRVAKGVYYRVGDFKGKPVETTETVLADVGAMGVTSKHIYFVGSRERFRIRFDRIVSLEAFTDGLCVMREAQSAKPQTFITGDGWFTYNLVASASQL